MKFFLHHLQLMAGIVLSMLVITACNEKNEVAPKTPDWDAMADHTLLMYIVGDNSLSNLLEGNVRDAQKAILDSVQAGTLNLVVMKDNDYPDDSYPSLYWVHRNDKASLDTVMITKWEEERNTASPEFLADVVKTTFSRFNTKIKGISLGSHATGWVPLTNYNDYSASSPRRAFGYDDKQNPVGSIELWDLAAALRQGPKLDYILMDCCHMAGAEVAYELCDVADYMIACPTEEEGAGLPHKIVSSALSRCSSASEIPQTLNYIANCYFDIFSRYSTGATISVIDLRQMKAVANAYQQLLAPNADRLEAYSKATGEQIDNWVKNFQYFGRETGTLHNNYYFYDILSVIDWLGSVDASAASAARQAVQNAVYSTYYTSDYRGIPIYQCSGLTVSLPEVLHLASRSSGYSNRFSPFDEEKLTTAYHLTAWGALMGY